MDGYIEIKGARVNNLKNLTLRIPRGKFVVITGVSGSGKSSLAFETPEDVYMFRALLQFQENEQAFGLGITNRIGKRMEMINGENEEKKNSNS